MNFDTIQLAKWIPALPAIAVVVCGMLGCVGSLRKLSAVVAIGSIGGAFGISVMILGAIGEPGEFHGVTVHAFEWINVGSFSADFSFFIDTLTIVMLLVVTGIGTLIAIYSAGYMKGDPGYARFFAYIALFIVTMTLLVMADNLLLLFLGWEGVGLSSYLLIGYYYRKPSAAQAAKKAFIVNRIGDFGFILGLMGVFVVFGTIEYSDILSAAQVQLDNAGITSLSESARVAYENMLGASPGLIMIIPFLLMSGAIGKSAQFPLHVWLPDAMEGPTPVSALIHAATMVTAGVYMIVRLIALFQLNMAALTTVAIVGGITAFFAATIALCQYDIKRVWAYSTISQLGYMFLGVGVLGTTGAIFHLFTHAFFKALLFLTAGSVMHALAGQLDMRKMSGMFIKMPVTGVLMFIGCLALAGVPYTSGWYSKDMILADTLAHPNLTWLGWIGIATALLTAFYSFRLWFRVFMGETNYEMSNEHHGYKVDRLMDDQAHEPHEMGWLINGPLVVLAMGAIAAGYFLHNWIPGMVPAPAAEAHYSATHVGAMSHKTAHAIAGYSGYISIFMIILAAYFHWFNRSLAQRIADVCGPVVNLLYHKYYVDELYHWLIVTPLRGMSWLCYLFDKYVIDGLIVNGIALVPQLMGDAQKSTERGVVQGYAIMMACGIVLILAIVIYSVVL